jgi:hypothetical protein
MGRVQVIMEVGGRRRHEPDLTQFASMFTAEVVGVFDSFRIFPNNMNSTELPFCCIYGQLLHTSPLPYIIQDNILTRN